MGEKYINQEKIKDYTKCCRTIYSPVTCLFVKYKAELSAEKNVESVFSLKYIENRQVLRYINIFCKILSQKYYDRRRF